MPVISRRTPDWTLNPNVEAIEYVRAVKPSPLLHGASLRSLVRDNAESLRPDFPNTVDWYMNAKRRNVVRRLFDNRNILHLVIHGTTATNTPYESGELVGVISLHQAEIPGVLETQDGMNVAAYLANTARGSDYLTMVAPELAANIDPNKTIWTVARLANKASVGLALKLGMEPVGEPHVFGSINDGVTVPRQLYVQTAGVIADTAKQYIAEHYPEVTYA